MRTTLVIPGVRLGRADLEATTYSSGGPLLYHAQISVTLCNSCDETVCAPPELFLSTVTATSAATATVATRPSIPWRRHSADEPSRPVEARDTTDPQLS